jgi:hypothetical protein
VQGGQHENPIRLQRGHDEGRRFGMNSLGARGEQQIGLLFQVRRLLITNPRAHGPYPPRSVRASVHGVTELSEHGAPAAVARPPRRLQQWHAMAAGESDLWVDWRGIFPTLWRLRDQCANGCLLSIAENGQQPQVISYGVVFAERPQACGAAREQTGGIWKPNTRNCSLGEGFNLGGVENSLHGS